MKLTQKVDHTRDHFTEERSRDRNGGFVGGLLDEWPSVGILAGFMDIFTPSTTVK